MPTISVFYGIVVQMFWNDHAPPHFHALYGDDEAVIEIQTLQVAAASFRDVLSRLFWNGRRSIVRNCWRIGTYVGRIRCRKRSLRWLSRSGSSCCSLARPVGRGAERLLPGGAVRRWDRGSHRHAASHRVAECRHFQRTRGSGSFRKGPCFARGCDMARRPRSRPRRHV